MNRKGIITDVLVWVIGVFVMVIIGIAGFAALSEFNTVYQEVDSVASNSSKAIIGGITGRYGAITDNSIAFAIIAGHLGIITLGVFLKSHPIVWIALFAVLMLVTIVAGFLASAWDDIASDPTLSEYTDNFTVSNWFLNNYLMVTLGLGFLDIMAFVATATLAGGDQ